MKSLLKFFHRLCVVYTVTSLVFLLLNLAITDSFENAVIRPDAFLLILPFSAGIALAGVLYAARSMPHALRLVLHFVTCTLSAFLFLYLPAGTGAGSGMKFLMLLLIALIYWMVMGPYLALTAQSRNRTNQSQEYRSVFKK